MGELAFKYLLDECVNEKLEINLWIYFKLHEETMPIVVHHYISRMTYFSSVASFAYFLFVCLFITGVIFKCSEIIDFVLRLSLACFF